MIISVYNEEKTMETFLGSFLEVGKVVGVSRSNFEKRHVELMQEFHSHLKDTRQKLYN